jgi:formamidopyrimidine-DNA glycosylase
MPELPEVETTVRGIRPLLEGRTIQDTWLDWPGTLVTPDFTIFRDRISGQRIQHVTRRAKYVVIHLEADILLVHLKMTGRLYVVPDDAEDYADQWVRLGLQLDNAQQLRFSDSRKFGRVYLVEDAEIVTGKLGPEPLEDDFTLEIFRERLARRKGVIKPLLLNQTFVAGLGNIYADESLHLAHILPWRKANSLTDEEIAALWQSIRQTLADGIAREGASVNWYRKPDGTKGTAQDGLYAYGQVGQICRTCHNGIIEKTVIGQRGTHYCPNCQR